MASDADLELLNDLEDLARRGYSVAGAAVEAIKRLTAERDTACNVAADYRESYELESNAVQAWMAAAQKAERERDAADEVVEAVRDHFGNADSPHTPWALEALANYDSVRGAS